MKVGLYVLSVVVLTALITGCGHWPAPIRSTRDLDGVSASEHMVVVESLPLESWPKLQKFKGLEHFDVAHTMASEVTDKHLKVFSQLQFPKLRQVSLAHGRQVTDHGLQALTNLSSIQGLQLIGTSITDGGMQVLATGFPSLRGINVEECGLVTERGFLSLTNSRTIDNVSLSLDPISQGQIENIIATVTNVTWWTISDPLHHLNPAPLRALGGLRKITINVVDENRDARSITNP